MFKRIAFRLMLGLFGFVCCSAQAIAEDIEAPPPSTIATLQQKRIALLEERVSHLTAIFQSGLIDRSGLIRPRMDLLNARLDYATASDEKRQLLTRLMKEYDLLIAIAEVEGHAPAPPATSGQRPRVSGATSEVLWLKSERIRVEIMRESLD